ncbi:MAG: right-handed parallel beta-helix repeat-containing protein [Acidobacteriota bacterium]
MKNGVACLAAGDTLYVRGGTYNESLMVSYYTSVGSIPSGTSWSNRTRIAAYPGDAPVWLRPLTTNSSAGGIGSVIWIDANVSYVEFDGINLDGSNLSGGVLWISTNNGNDPHHIRFQNAEVIAGQIGGAAVVLGAHTRIGATGSNEILNVKIHGGGLPGLCGYQCASYGIYVEGPNNLIEGCDIYDTSGAGVHIFNANGDSPDNNTIRNNRIHDITRTGSLDEVWGILVLGANNKIYNNSIYGISVGNVNQGNAAIALAGPGHSVYNNTVYGNTGWGIVTGWGASSNGSVIRNNISYGNSLGNYANYGVGTFQSNNLFTDPRFANAGGADFRLRSDSPAIDQGAFLDTVPFDMAGVARPQGNGYDIGAYEFSGTSSSPTSPPTSAPGTSVSVDGASVPGAASVTDSSLNVWTIGSGQVILRNGSQANGGYGSQILWYQGVIYVLGTDSRWWRWTGSTWAVYGSASPSSQQVAATGSGVSADGASVPAAASVTDSSLNVWTIGSGQVILRNGTQANGGYGSQILWYQGVIYVLGTDFRWWRWTGSTWAVYGSASPSTQQVAATGSGASADGATVPGVSSITDSSLNVWTIGSGQVILRNGTQANGGYGSQILWYQGVIYVFGTDSRWWRWTGSTWAVYGSSSPSSQQVTATGSGVSADGTSVPGAASSVTDSSLNVWTIGAGLVILRNGTQANGGYGSQIVWYQGVIYVFGTDSRWWRWTGSTWAVYGSIAPI